MFVAADDGPVCYEASRLRVDHRDQRLGLVAPDARHGLVGWKGGANSEDASRNDASCSVHEVIVRYLCLF